VTSALIYLPSISPVRHPSRLLRLPLSSSRLFLPLISYLRHCFIQWLPPSTLRHRCLASVPFCIVSIIVSTLSSFFTVFSPNFLTHLFTLPSLYLTLFPSHLHRPSRRDFRLVSPRLCPSDAFSPSRFPLLRAAAEPKRRLPSFLASEPTSGKSTPILEETAR
jgi:hypothetical protein